MPQDALPSRAQAPVAAIRAAVKDRATWLAVLYRQLCTALPAAEVERHARAAIYEYGRLKAAKDPPGMDARLWVERHMAKGSGLVFDSEIEVREDGAVQRMRHCALVEAWREIGFSTEQIDLLCDIAMEGDRGRAAAHGLELAIEQRIGRGDPCCTLRLRRRAADPGSPAAGTGHAGARPSGPLFP
ncbi:MAG: L-2-amino-thiazoline-4-carboxylic acid hydrolase [Deltaproteobacteria bacterium]|nr:L-2-amino-thiazoline-4-carboxylic acid hydrolase [Deltaproteobacteria bacterium]